jgi:cell division protein FtsW (lipid II flippase)
VSIPAPPRPDEPSVPKRRNVELAMSMFAVVIAMFAYANVGLAEDPTQPGGGKLPAGMWGYGAGLAAIVIAAHLLIRYAAPYADPLFLPLATFLNGIGLVIIHRLDLHKHDLARAIHAKHMPTGSAPNQLMFSALGIVGFAAVLLFIKDHKILQRYAYVSMVAGLFLVAVPAVLPNAVSGANGAKSWVRLGGFSIQPAEFGKLLLVSFFAAFLVSKRDALRVASRKFMGLHVPRGRDLGPIAVCWLFAMAVLFVETDLGVSLMFFGAFVVLLYIATERTSWLLIGVTAFIGGATAIALTTAHVQARVTGWLHPFDAENPGSKASNQIAQSIYGFATGGIFGKGLNQGRPWLVGFADDADFILVSVGEELGMIGLFALMMVYMLIVMRGFKTAILIRDGYGKLLASGLAVTFALQVFITAGGVMRVIPLTGLPMPFLAAGGSALVSNWVLIALLIRLSDAARRPPPPAIPLTDEDLRAMRLAAAARIPSNAPPQYSATTQALAGRRGAARGGPPGGAGVPPQSVDPGAQQPPRGYGEPAPWDRPGIPGSAADPTEVVAPASQRREDQASAPADSELTEAHAMPYADVEEEHEDVDPDAVTEAVAPRHAERAGHAARPVGAHGDGDQTDFAEYPEFVEQPERQLPEPTGPAEANERPGPAERRYGP